MGKEPKFSIVIPTLNEEVYLPRLLESLSKQKFSDFEVILVDAHSDDKTVVQAKKFMKDIELRIFNSKKRNVAYQRNFGVQKAVGEWIIFLDSDEILGLNFLEELTLKLDNQPEVDIFTCQPAIGYEKLIEQIIIISFRIALYVGSLTKPLAIGVLIGVRGSVARKFSFDESICPGEDTSYVDSIVNSGYKFKLFGKPQHRMSMRRFREYGYLSMAANYLKSGVMRGLGYDPREKGSLFKNYPMLGGSMYKKKERMADFSMKISRMISKTLGI
jgi:glycosyltransferase involved in cell wall biosynthesis